MSALTQDFLWNTASRMLAGDAEHGDDGHGAFGVHIEYEDLFNGIVFLACIYVSGKIANLMKMPDLVGEIVCGILLGPQLADFVPNAEAWVLLGEVGLVLLVIEAGIDIDLSTLKLIGTRGFLIAFFGSILPIGIGMLIAYLVGVDDTKGVIAAGAVFGPTSLGIALNILRGGGILNTPVGQLIISAAVIDDMIALVVLSQLEALAGDITVVGVLVPIISALAFLVIGGYVAIFVLPGIIEKNVLARFDEDHRGKVEMVIMWALVLVLMPATFYGKASYLMGAFLAGLTFCSSHDLHVTFVRQFKRILQWLMRIFFAASIGFQVPVKDFASFKVIWQGLVFTFALLGKLAVGFMVPNFTQSSKFTKFHLRDCLITGFSMAAEGEFAFVIAVFAVDQELIGEELYASVVLAVLLSTIIPPFLLRFTISYYNKKAEDVVAQAAKEEMDRQHDLDTISSTTASSPAELIASIKNKSSVFLCIQTQSESSWGLMHGLMQTMAEQGLDIIDHRAWSPRGINTTLVNEVYARGQIEVKEKGAAKQALDSYIQTIKDALMEAINQPQTSKVNVQRWFPGVVQEIVEEVNEKHNRNVRKRLLAEATQILERKQHMQLSATHEKTVDDILGEMEKGDMKPMNIAEEAAVPEEGTTATDETTATGGVSGIVGKLDAALKPKPKPRRRVRQKMRSTPVVGGGLFGEEAKHDHDFYGHREGSDKFHDDGDEDNGKSKGGKKADPLSLFSFAPPSSVPAEILVRGESYSIRISKETFKDLQKGFAGQTVDSRGIEISGVNIEASDNTPVVNRLRGFVRNGPLNKIQEETIEDASEISSQVTDDNK
eukprot:CAMPEP_0119546592 /NCGR_PEP_ID=MMETSP1352-20130426/944_1 /TAXON_ID=265584 /ORGANISM="Stauroneis constricta, Strain CCMP1120" /LENGTH=831 /DNA_ID=CAMNT_0007591311 /DNA_START=186 /DNA_END=2681 /DNA_ORIENTATION=-